MTEFQDKVFAIVKKIPKGKTMTYGEIAREINSSPRAVGQALKRNPNPIIVPCHRVIRKDGKIGGYTFKGKFIPEMKENLLKKELTAPNASKNNISRD